MSAIPPAVCSRLIDLLLRAPFTATGDGRNLLLADLPATLRATITRSENPRVDIAAIVNTVASADTPVGETPPLALVVENALYLMQGTPLADDLHALLAQITSSGRGLAYSPPLTPPDNEAHFQALVEAMERSDWNTVLDLAASLPPDYPGLAPLVARAREAQQQRTALYNSIAAAWGAEDWGRVLNLAVSLPPGDPIVGTMVEQARQRQATTAPPSVQQLIVQRALLPEDRASDTGLESAAPDRVPGPPPTETTAQGHTAAVTGLAWAPDGTRYASASADGTVGLWTPTNTTATRLLPGDGGDLTCVAWSPDGRLIAAAGKSGAILLWDAATGAPQPPLHGHATWVHTLAWAPGAGSRLASGDDSGLILLWDLPSAGMPSTPGTPLRGHTGAVLCVAWAPDGHRLVSGSWDGTLRQWDAQTGQPGPTASSYGAGFHAVAWGPRDDFIASGASDKQVQLWAAGTFQLVCALSKAGGAAPDAVQTAYQGADYVLPAHDGEVYTVAWRPDGWLLASGAGDYTIRLWDSPAWTEHATLLGHQGIVNAVAWSPDGTLLASGADDRTIRLWRIA